MKGAIRLGLAVSVAFFAGLGGWAVTAPLDGAVVGSGNVVVQGNRKAVQHREGGIVSELLVQEGAVVEPNQVLLRLDDTQPRALFLVHRSQLLADQALMARCLAELEGRADVAYPAEMSIDDTVARTMMERETVVFRRRTELLTRQLAVLDQRIEQARQQEGGARAQIAAGVRQLELAEQEHQAIATLERAGLASKNRLLEVSRTLESLRGHVSQLATDVSRLGAMVVELEAEKLRIRESALTEVTRDLREAQLRINDVMPRLAADRDQLARLEIRAPIGGQVVNLTVFTHGGVVEAGRSMMEIVPTQRMLVAEAEIRPEDVEHLRVGQRADIVAIGFNPRTTAPIVGEIKVISADRVVDPRSGQSYFKAEIRLISDREEGRLLARLGPGMPVEVVVPVQPRTAFDYLSAPLRESFRNAMREL